MDVKTLCLGVLSRGAASGYEIRKQFEEGPFSHFYEAGFSSIYPALKRLSEEGLIVGSAHAQETRPDKKVYRITPAGDEALQEALLQPPALDRLRSDLLFTLTFAHRLPPRHIDRITAERLAWYREQIARMEGCARPENTLGEDFVRGYGLAVYRAAADYLERHRPGLIEAARQYRRLQPERSVEE